MAKSPKVEITPEILVWAREQCAYAMPEVAKKLKIKKEQLLSWEEGKSLPSFAQLLKLANLYKRPSALFFLNVPPSEPPLPKDFRVIDESEVSHLSPKTRIEIRKAQRKRAIAVELADQLGEEILEFSEKANLNSSIRNLVDKYRNRLKLDYSKQTSFISEFDAFRVWKEAIESLGVLVFQASLDSIDEFRGLAIYNRKFPLILLNTKDSTRGKIFSLLHEFCHLLLHTSGIGNMNPPENRTDKFNQIEVFCNEFAGECLVPSQYLLNEPEIKALTGALGDRELGRLVKRYQASGEVILRRLLQNNKISKTFYERKRKEIFEFYKKNKKKGGPVPYDVRSFSYNGEPYTKLVLESYTNEIITASDVSNYLGVKLNHVDKMEQAIKSKSSSGGTIG